MSDIIIGLVIGVCIFLMIGVLIIITGDEDTRDYESECRDMDGQVQLDSYNTYQGCLIP